MLRSRLTSRTRFARDLLFVRCPRRVRRALRWHILRSHGVALTQLALAAGAVIAPSLALANPNGAQVAAGNVQMVSSLPTTLDITQTSKLAIINWQSFNIGLGETVNFIQPSLNSVALNRVLGNDPSAIFGRLNANGTVMLVNPNGIVFGASSRVDVGGLVATTANIKDSDFLAGRLRFDQASTVANASVANAGQISIKDSGLAALVAPRVQNSGVIEAKLGRIALGGAERFTLDFQGDGLLSFSAGSAVQANGQPLVSNTGTLRAEGGTVLLTAQAVQGVVDKVINTSGVIEATSVGDQAGRIVLSGGEAGSVAVSGTLDASGRQAAQTGGSVQVTGAAVQVNAGAVIDASGHAGGGEIALGSQGRASGYADKSTTTTVAAGASLRADALARGDGGSVTAWSKDTTVFAGSISARGGEAGGNGGFAEVSSQKNIGLSGSVDLRAPQGKTGMLLLDPTDLRITDTTSGGSQNANAADGTVAAGDANQGSGSTLNTVSRGVLEGLSGSTNITLQATGQITVDAMAGGVINLATTAGHGVTLSSTQTGGIRFVDAQTELRTQGGDITLDALGIGSTLSNIGKLSSNGGAISLSATGDVQLAGNVNAGSGAVSVQSTVGNISNAAATSPLLTGSSVNLSALGGSIGASGSAISSHTGNLSLSTGGSAFASNDMALSSLSLTANHASPSATNSYQVGATGLNLQITDGASLDVTQATQSGLALTLSADRAVQLGTVNLGAAALSVSSTGGNITGASGNLVTAGGITLSAEGSNGNNGAIGTSGQAINTATATVSATAGSGGTYLANTGALALDRLSTTGSSSVTASGTLTAGNVSVGSATLALGSSGGSVLDDGNTATRISAGTLQLTAGGAIGSAGTKLQTNASTISANAAAGGIYANTSATSSVLSSITSGNGAIDIGVGGSSTLTSLTSSTDSAANSITVTASGTGSMSVGTINAGSQGDVNLTTASGSISGNTGLITGETVTLNAANSGSVSVRTAASHLDVQAGSSSISITQTGSVTLDRIATPSTFASVTSSSGDITVGAVSTSSSGQVTLTASAGSIFDDANTSTRIVTGTASLSASGNIGTASHAVQTKATGLAATSTGNLYLSNTDATLTSLSITNRHTVPGVANVLQVSSDYLTFDVTDSGTQYGLNRIVGVPLGSLSFNGDQTAVIGQVQSAGSVSITATQGHLLDDGNTNTRATSGSTLTLSAAQGNVGSVANPIGANAGSLALTTRGDLYVSDITDLSTLTVTSTHPDTTTSYGMGITAPSLKLSVSDSAAGHNVQTLSDNSSLSLTFTSDRDITLGDVNVTNTGTARFTSSGGAIKDDGNKSTVVLANSTTLSGQSVGASGAAHMDVVTGTLAASASAGGVYVELPMPTGSTNTTSTVTLGTVTATGPVVITALEGDLSLGGFMTATNQAVSLTATQGSILSPSGYSIAIGSGSLSLDAGKAIGVSGRTVPITSSGGSLSANAGTGMFVSSSGATTLSSLDAGSSISYTQSSGAVTVGHVDATAGGTVAITASSGAIQDDGSAGTGIRANQITLSAAQSNVGATGAAIGVDTPKLLVTANGNVAVSDSATLDTLSLTRGSGSAGSIAITAGAGQSFSLSEDGTRHYVQDVSSTTPLAFSFSGQRDVRVGDINVGTAGSASISTTTHIVNDGTPGSAIGAGTVSLTSGTAGSIGATGAGNAISLEGTTALTLSTGRNAFVASDTALTDLTVTSTNATTAVGTASVFGLSGLGQGFTITDSGTTQHLDFSGTALTNTSFTTSKNIDVGAITATGDVRLSTSGGGANSNITSDSGSGTIAGNRVLLTASSSTAGGGSIGSSGTALRVDAPTVILNGSGNVYVNDAQNLTGLDMTLTHGTNTTYGYGVTASNLNSFSITDGNTQSLGLAVSGAMDFAYSVDRALSLATIDAGTSTTGTISLTSRSAPTGTNAQINRSSGSLTGGRISLSAVGFNGGVGAGATLSTNTKNLSIASGGNVSVSNSTTLTSLSLDARHNTSGSSTHSYSLSSTGLTFSISDTLGNNAFQLANISQSGLDLSVKADRVITASSINTGAGGKVTLESGSYVQGGSGANAGSPSITTGDLTLRGGSAFGYQGSTPLYTAASTLSSNLSNTLYLSNAGALTLNTNTVAGSADVASSNNSLLQGASGLFTTPTLKLSANQSLGSTGSLLTDVRRLTLVSRGNIDVSNASDLYALTMTSTHATAGVQNTISVAADRLALSLTDSVGGNQYHLSNLVDSSGLDFTLSTDVALNLGTVDAKAGRSLALYSTGSTTSITNDGASLLTGSSITLSAGGSVGAAGSSSTRMQTDALGVTVATGASAYLDNAQDLSSLSLTSSQTTGGVAPTYQFTAPALSFDVTDNGNTHVNNVSDSTGLNFTLNTRRDQEVHAIDVGRSGTVSLTSTGDILGDASSSNRISAASATLYASNGGAIGSVGNPIHLSAPLLSVSPTGALNVESDTHIDRLSISTTHPTVTYGGTYSIVSTPISGAAYQLFSATDSVTGTALTSLTDTEGLAFSFTSDRAMQVGSLNLGSTGTVALTGTGSGGILGDGNASTQVQAASLNMVSYGGAIGASGSGNAIDATVNSLSATAQGGGVNLALHGRTALGSISATGGVNLVNDVGDIALGSINAGGNAVSIDNQGGSILSGSIFNTTTVGLTASGSIGNTSAIGTSANGGGTTTLTASASAAHGASGSVAVSESYNLYASSVTAPAAVTLSSGYGLLAGTITSGAAVSLSSSQGSINGTGGNLITGSSVDLSARYGTGNGIGNSSVRLNVNTPRLTLNTPGDVYVTDSADLSRLTIDRTNYTGTGSSGTLSVIASGLTFSASDSSNVTTLTNLVDGTGLDFTYLGIGSLSIGNVNVGSNGSALLQAYLSSGDGNINAINGSSLITAGSLTLQAYGTGSNIGSNGTALGTAAGSVTASAGTGGIYLRQAGSLNLSSLSTSGNLSVNATSGDLTLGTLSYGSGSTLSLTAGAGSILAGTGTLAGGGSGASITLSAANGIGTDVAPVLVNASAGHTVNASVTGNGSLYLGSTGTLNGGLTTSVNNGSTNVTAAGNITLTSMSTGTEAAGNDISVTASAGNITVNNVSGGSTSGSNAVNLSANAGRIVANPGATLQAYEVNVHGATGVGDSTNRLSASGQRVQVSSGSGDIYLGASAPSVLTSVSSNGGLINIATTADLLIANASSGGGNIVVTATGAGTDLLAGDINAGSGSVSLSAASGAVLDDGHTSTRVSGASVTLSGSAGVGSATQTLQTAATTLAATSTGGAVYLADQNSSGVTLSTIVAGNGAVNISTAGPTTATSITAQTDASGNNITLSTSSGDLTLGTLTAGATQGNVNVSAAGSILSSGSGTNITAQSASLAAGNDIGVVTNLATGAGTPVTLNVGSITGLSSSGSNRVVSVNNLGSSALVLGGGALSLGSGSSAYIQTAGDLDVSAGVALANGNLSLNAGGTLMLPSAALATTGAVSLTGATDILASGASPRDLHVSGSSLTLRSGAAGGSTQLTTAVGSIDAQLTGAGNLTVANTGTLSATTLQTSDGDISATSSTGLTATSVVAGGSGRGISLTATTGNLTAGTVNAGSGGSIALTAGTGSVLGASATLTASFLDLSSGTSIGSSGAAFNTSIANVSAQVTGTGDLYLSSAGPLTLAALSTANGDIAVTAGSHISVGSLSAGQSGNVSLTSTGGNVTLTQAYSNAGSDTSRSGLAVQGSNITLAGVTTSGAQSYTGAVTVGGNLSGKSVLVTGNTTLSGGARTLTANAGNLQLTGLLNGGGQAATLNAGSGSVTVGGVASNLASLSATGASVQVAAVATVGGAQTYTGATTLAGGYTTQGGAFTVNGATQLGGTTTVTTAGGNASFGGAVNGAADLTVNSSGATSFGGAVSVASLTTDAAGTLAVNGGSVNTTGAQSYGERMVLGADTTLTGSTITLAQGADATTAGQQGLSVNGNAVVNGALGANAALKSLAVNGSTALAGNVTTTGAQSYTGDVTLSGGARTLASGAGNLQITGQLVGGGQAATLNAGSGNLTVGAAASNLVSLSATGASVQVAGVATSGAQTYTGATTLAGSSYTTQGSAFTVNGATQLGGNTSVTTAGGNASFGGAINGAGDLTVSTGAGSAGFSGAVGQTTRLGNLTVNSSGATSFAGAVSAAAVTTDAAGSLAVNGGSVNTTGAQSYGERMVLGADTTLTGSTLTLAQGADAASAGQQGLSVSGNAVLNGALGANAALKSLAISGSTALNGGSVTTSGAQSYTGAVALGADTTLTGQGVAFGGTVDGNAALTVAAGSGAASFGGAVGSTTRLGAVTVNSSGATSFGGAVRAASMSTDAAGSLQVNGGSVNTTGTQSYGERAVLGADAVLTGSTITLSGGADATSAGGQSLTIMGDAVVAGALGANQALSALSVSGTSALTVGSVTTSGAQSYTGAATLAGNTTLTGNGVNFASSVTSPQTLSVAGGSGGARFDGAVQVASLAVSGPTTLAGGSVTTSGDQQYNGAVQVVGNHSLHSTGGALSFASTIDSNGGANLSLASDAGAVALGGAVGSSGVLGALTVSAATTLDFSGNVHAYSINTTGTAGLTRFLGTVLADGPGGIGVSSGSVSFAQGVTATTGGLTVANTSNTGTLSFAPAANVHTASGFVQTGGAGITLPASVLVDHGPITLAAAATLPVGNARIETEGDITMSSLIGAGTGLTLASGHGPVAGSGLPYSLASGSLSIDLIDVASLWVPDAKSATLFGSIGGQGGAIAASRINSKLMNSPYFINTTPWGPLEVINTLVATTVPRSVVPSTPGASPLFTGVVDRGGVAPNVLGIYAAPQVLTVAPMSPVILTPVPPGVSSTAPIAPSVAPAPEVLSAPKPGDDAAKPEDSPR